jgi:hypothetical protein
MENETSLVQVEEPQEQKMESSGLSPEQKRAMIGLSIVGLVALVAFIVFIVFLLQPGAPTERIRDVFIIVMALESLIIGLVLVILIVQLARLTNLIQNEIRPILDSTNETVSHLRGTTVFLSDNLVEPVIKLNEYLAGLSQLLTVIGLARKPKKGKTTKGE